MCSVLFLVVYSCFHFCTNGQLSSAREGLCCFLMSYLLSDNLLLSRMLFFPNSQSAGPSFDKVVVNMPCLQEAREGLCASWYPFFFNSELHGNACAMALRQVRMGCGNTKKRWEEKYLMATLLISDKVCLGLHTCF